MNLPKLALRRAWVAVALCAGFVLITAGRAQPASQPGSTRFLFIFNTSADMKKRLPAVQTEVNQLLATSLGGQLQPGDSVGVWTFDQDLHIGQFPLQYWKPEDAVTLASGINKSVGKQHFANRTRFDALQPQLNQVIQNSGRLTVLIFCDGEDEIKGTPYDDSINQVFRLRQAEQKRTAQPFVLVLRTQRGQYAGCTLNFPPGMVSLPEFPPLPAPPAPALTPPPAPPPAAVVTPPPTGPPLIIVGKQVMTNWPPSPAPIPMTNTTPVVLANVVTGMPANPVTAPLPANPTPAVQTNTVPAPSAISFAPTNSIAPTNAAVRRLPANPAPAIQTNATPAEPASFAPAPPAKAVSTPPANPTTSTNAAVSPPEASSPGHKWALVIGGLLLIAAGTLAVLAIFHHRRPGRGSLITRSMRKD